MQRKEKEGVCCLEFELLQPFSHLKQAVFLKNSQIKEGFSLRDSRDQQGELETDNQRKALTLFGLEKGVKLKQVHGKKLKTVQSPLIVSGFQSFQGYDGVMTEQKDLGLLIRHADCQAAIFFDPRQNVIANVHCGWRGSVKNIYAHTIDALHATYGCDPKDLFVCISPSLGPLHGEFVHYKKEFPKDFWGFEEKKNHFNFWEISRCQLLQKGILEKHIEIAGLCTYEHIKECFSYRREKVLSGLHGTLVALSN